MQLLLAPTWFLIVGDPFISGNQWNDLISHLICTECLVKIMVLTLP
jgi:hypothetical protein